MAGEEEGNYLEDSLEQKIWNKLLESETCEKEKEETPIEKKELTQEIQEEAIKNKYLEPVQKKSLQNLGTITVKIMNYDTGEPLLNATLKISPNPFTLNNFLVIHDNNKLYILISV